MAFYSKREWLIIYDKAIRPDGSLLFPKRLSKKILDEKRRVMGSTIFANQYLNEIIEDEKREFKSSWLKYYDVIPELKTTFCFVDPAISMKDGADYTAYVIVHIGEDRNWYVEMARRQRITPTETIDLLFKLQERFKCHAIGVEAVAYQEALIHFLVEEMKRRNLMLPVKDIKRGPDKTKEMRIRSLVPRFEFGTVFINRGLVDFEDEYNKFPKGLHDDILDALSSIEEIAFPPHKKKEPVRVPASNSKDYERFYIDRLKKRTQAQSGS